MPSPAGALCACCRTEPVSPAWHPFCSERCRLRDLARWLDGDYRIAGEPVSPDPADPDAPAPGDR